MELLIHGQSGNESRDIDDLSTTYYTRITVSKIMLFAFVYETVQAMGVVASGAAIAIA